MESTSKDEVHVFKEKPDLSTNNVIEGMTMACIDPGDVSNDQEKSTTFEHRSFLHKTYHNILREQVTVSKVIIAAIIVFIIGTFSVPIILYYALKTDPVPELENVLRDVNTSTVI